MDSLSSVLDFESNGARLNDQICVFRPVAPALSRWFCHLFLSETALHLHSKLTHSSEIGKVAKSRHFRWKKIWQAKSRNGRKIQWRIWSLWGVSTDNGLIKRHDRRLKIWNQRFCIDQPFSHQMCDWTDIGIRANYAEAEKNNNSQ